MGSFTKPKLSKHLQSHGLDFLAARVAVAAAMRTAKKAGLLTKKEGHLPAS